MFFTIFCCIATGLTIYCVLNRFNRRTLDLAVHAAVHEAKKEFHERSGSLQAQLAAKERELVKARELLKLHETVPTPKLREAPAVAPRNKDREGLNVFEMSRPFTDTSYNHLLAVSDVDKVEPAATRTTWGGPSVARPAVGAATEAPPKSAELVAKP